tara:strand:- start:95 stop:226 length:132 start_codon:yes stop_codon:yes gene_type:complete
MNKENASKLWKMIQEAGDYLDRQNDLNSWDNVFKTKKRFDNNY